MEEVPKHSDEWALYIIGILLALLWKWFCYVRTGWAMDPAKTTGASTKEWFLEPSLNNGASWATTFGVLWVFGDCYINGVQLLGPWLNAIPVVKSVSFLLGTLTEYLVPGMTKWVINKIRQAFGS